MQSADLVCSLAAVLPSSPQPLALARQGTNGDWHLQANAPFERLCACGDPAGDKPLAAHWPRAMADLAGVLRSAWSGVAGTASLGVRGLGSLSVTATPLPTGVGDGGIAAVLLVAQVLPPAIPLPEANEAALLNVIADALPDAVYAKDLQGRLLFANRTTLELIGLPADAVIGRTDAEFLADASVAAQVMATDRRIMDSGQLQQVVEHVPNRDGTPREWHSYKAPWRDASGQIVGLLGISRDITERLRLEKDLEKSRQTLDNVLDSITDGFAVLDRDWRYTYFNEQGARMLGMEREQVVGGVLWELFPHARESLFGQEYLRCVETGQPSSFEAYYPEPLNRWIECHCYPSPEGLAVFFRDVTQRHRLEDEARASAARLQRVFDASPIGMVTGCAEGKIIQANDAFLQLVGVPRSELEGGNLTWAQLTPPEWLQADLQAVERLKASASAQLYEKEYAHACGHRVPVMVAVAPFDDVGDLLIAFVLDLSDRKRVERTLKEADRRKNEFLAMLAHELRNPLAPLRSGMDVLARDPTPARVEHMTKIMDRQMRHLVRLVDDLLDIARISSGKIRVENQRIDLRQPFASALEALGPAMIDAGHVLTTESPSEPVWVAADPVRTTQVLSNLLHNACKYTPRGGRITARLCTEGERAMVRVDDNGQGIRPDRLEEIFSLFVQEPERAKHGTDGLGVGLALARELMRLQGGDVFAESAGLGQGSRFTVVLPSATADHA